MRALYGLGSLGIAAAMASIAFRYASSNASVPYCSRMRCFLLPGF